VNSLVASMTGRGFGLYPKRTQLHPLRIRALDVAIIAMVFLFCMATVYFDWELPRHLLI
jgi:energy-coupling factor transporter transmembrane protein EcfT